MKRPLTRISNPFFIFEEVKISNIKEQVGIDASIFHACIKTTDFSVEISVPLYELMEFSKTGHPKTAAYFKDVRKRIPGPGERNQEMIEIMLEEEFDFFFLLGDYIDKMIDIETYYQQEKELTAGMAADEYCHECEEPLSVHRLSKEEHGELFAPLKEFHERQQQFAEALMVEMSDKVRECYPEFAEADTDRLMELTDILSQSADDVACKVAFLAGPPADTHAYRTISDDPLD